MASSHGLQRLKKAIPQGYHISHPVHSGQAYILTHFLPTCDHVHLVQMGQTNRTNRNLFLELLTYKVYFSCFGLTLGCPHLRYSLGVSLATQRRAVSIPEVGTLPYLTVFKELSLACKGQR